MTTPTSPAVGILVGGGPAPGINGVISAATIEARNRGWRVLGFLDGLKWLARGEVTHVRELDIPDVSRIHMKGGSILRTSRAGRVQDPEISDLVLDGLDSLGVRALITIGGDGTGSAAALLSARKKHSIRFIHVPKTIDNDIPLPGGFSTFGFQTARHIGVQVVESLMEDARTCGRWYLVVTMGRQAGHLALSIGKAAGATLTLIPEEFPEGRISLADLLRPIEGSIIRRLAEGRTDGVVVMAEGLAERVDPVELQRQQGVERDAHGHIRLNDLPLGYALRKRLSDLFKERGVKVGIMEKLVGYELRCADPIPFDAEYTRDLGFGAMHAILDEEEDWIICRAGGKLSVEPFESFRDPDTEKLRVRFVDTRSGTYRVSLRYQIRMQQKDLENAVTRKKLAEAAGLSEEELLERFGGNLDDS